MAQQKPEVMFQTLWFISEPSLSCSFSLTLQVFSLTLQIHTLLLHAADWLEPLSAYSLWCFIKFSYTTANSASATISDTKGKFLLLH